MGWFFPTSKALEFLISPSHILLWLVVAAPIALLMGRRRAAVALALLASTTLVLIGVTPFGAELAKPLEDRYPRSALPPQIKGVVTLGAGLSTSTLLARNAPGTSPSIDRIVSTYELARLHPEALVVFSGGWGRYSDSIAAENDFSRLGLSPSRLVLEGRSRNTFENLDFTKEIVRPTSDEVRVLATSAIQMPRAMNVARRLGWRMLPWPTDYKTESRDMWRRRWFEIGDNLALTDEAAHEWIGLAVYRMAGLARGAESHPRPNGRK